jgi:hypothetical protein
MQYYTPPKVLIQGSVMLKSRLKVGVGQTKSIIWSGGGHYIRNFLILRSCLMQLYIIILVPKKKNPSSMGEYRLISYCNLIYTSISKILANRLFPGLADIVSLNQGAFIPKKSIAENILLPQELVCDYHKAKGPPRCTLKIDLMKAYDSVSWDFILHCLLCFGVPKKYDA